MIEGKSKKKILIIEDEEEIRISLAFILRKVNYSVIEAEDGVEGLEKAREENPDLILCDINMPVMDGFAVLGELSKDSILRKIPFLFLTGRNQIPDIRKGMEAGADDYLVKPFVASDVLKAIEIRFKKFESIQSGNKIKNEPIKTSNYNINSTIMILIDSKPQKIKLNEIIYIEAMEDYSKIFLSGNKKIIAKKLIKEWENLLPAENFIRIHRSTIISLDYVERFEKWFNSAYKVFMKELKEPLVVSRRYSAMLRKIIKS